ncbi:MAG: sigma-54 interaction domain-containing protein [Bacillota bacterium]
MTLVPWETLTALLDGMGEALILANPCGEIAAVNRPMEQLLGLDRASLLGRRPADLEAEGLWLPPTLRRCLESGSRQTLVQEVKGRRLALTAFGIEGGWVLATARDITELDRLQRQVERMEQERERFHHELAGLRAGQTVREEVIASSRAMQKVLELARRVAAVDSTILLLGESGVGKGVLARELHRASARWKGPFVKVDCAAIPESLLESELFGYAPGSFTGARREGKAGLIEQANGGTLFLDEIGDLSPSLQVKLLHVVQERRFTRVGSVAPVAVDIRIVAATHRDLEQMVAEGRFREDLYYRLNVVPITIPPLRERPEDVPALVRAFLTRFCDRYRVERQLSAEAMERLLAYRWPGNVRELENVIERLVVTVEEREIRPEHLPAFVGSSAPVSVQRLVPLKEAVEALELELVGTAYQKYGSSVKVGEVLGIHQTTAARKIREWKARQGDGGPESSPSSAS